MLTWHVHGNYLYYLSQARHEFFLVTLPGHPPGHAGRTGSLPWGANVHEVPAAEVSAGEFDCVLYQSRRHWDEDRLRWLSPAQRSLPAIYLEHDPPQQHPTATRHPAADSDARIVHVTHFNALMWDNGQARTHVIEHGVLVPPEARYTGERDAGIVVVNHLRERGRRLGCDVYESVRGRVPLTLVGMGSTALGGCGEKPNLELPAFMSGFRFFFNPIRYTSLGLSVLEAMTVGLPVVALATTEMATVIRNGENGYADTNVERLVEVMHELIADPALARRWGEAARACASTRFSIGRFAADWERLIVDAAREG
uniref:Glycosyl transferase n=1 Tax=consortium cosmid clone pGZ1 TaxID=397422 RepID=Q0MX71_9BACT|nr:glycosyl transferase [consortium cosmid clone pGZ1]